MKEKNKMYNTKKKQCTQYHPRILNKSTEYKIRILARAAHCFLKKKGLSLSSLLVVHNVSEANPE